MRRFPVASRLRCMGTGGQEGPAVRSAREAPPEKGKRWNSRRLRALRLWEMSAPAVSAVGMREPRQCGEEPRAVRPPPLPPSSPAPRQYARELVTTGVIIPQLQSTGISRTNKPGVPRILRALRGQFLVTLGDDSTLTSSRKRRPTHRLRRPPVPTASPRRGRGCIVPHSRSPSLRDRRSGRRGRR